MDVMPPGDFIAGSMKLVMMVATKWDSKFVTDFETQSPWLRKTQVMRVRRLPSANETWVRGNKSQMGLVTKTLGFGDGQNALIDPSRR